MSPKTILITGGAGFIGSALIRNLISCSSHKIVNVDNLTYAGNPESLELVENDSRYFFEKVDICDSAEINRLFLSYKPDIVIHLAAESHVDRSIDTPGQFIMTNIVGTYNLLELATKYWHNLDAKKKSIFRFLHVSTDEVYGDLSKFSDSFTEDNPYSPSSPYSASKASSDHLVRAWKKTFNLPTMITNCSNNYGPYQFPEKLIPLMIQNALKLAPLPVYGDGKQVRDWLYVDDHVRALIDVALNGEVGETYNIGGHNEMQNIQVIKTVCAILDNLSPCKSKKIQKYEELITFVKDRAGHDKRYAINAQKIYNDLGWLPMETFDTGIEKTVKWYLANQKWSENVQDGSYQGQRLGVIK